MSTAVPANIHITHWGDSGPRVVLVHGSAQGSEVGGDGHFSAQQRLAERGWQLWVPDRPGHGRSPSPGRPDDAEADGAWVAELLGNEEGEGAHLVGHSFGGCVALNAAARRPGAVRSLTLIEPAMMQLAAHLPVVRPFLFQIVKTLYFSWSAASRIQKFVELVNIPPDIRGEPTPEALARTGKAIKALKLPSRKALQQQLDTVREAGIPLWLVSGGWSPAFDATAGLVARAGGGRHDIIASPHHFPQRVSDEFNQRLAAFMQQADEAR